MPQQVGITGPAYETVKSNNPQKCINWYLEKDESEGKFPFILRPTPGLKAFATMGSATEIRGMIQHRGVLYCVADDAFYSVSSAGTETSEGSLDTSTGLVKMAASNDQIMIVDGTKGYTYTISTDTFAEITDADFPSNPDDVTYQDGYFIMISKTDHKFYLSGINDGQSWDALDFASATGDPDYLVGIQADHREIWLFGTRTTEIWYNSGNATFPFEKRPGVLLHKGLAATHSVARANNSLYWLASDEAGQAVVVRADGYTPRVISSTAVSQAIQSYDTIDDAYAYNYRLGKNEFYVLTFPTEDVTWVFNAATEQWHQLQSYESGAYHKHRSCCYAFAYGKHIVGDPGSNNLYELDEETYLDGADPIRRVRVTNNFNRNNNLLSLYNFVVDIEPGIGDNTGGQGDDPQLMLRVSKDGGHTWGNEMWRDMGKAGVYNQRVKWDALGQGRNWAFEITVSDPVDAVVLGAYVDIEESNA
jgi:hypothetical protein